MKVSMLNGAVLMAPENEEDHAVMHQMHVCGIKQTRMMNSSVEVYGPGLRGPLMIETWPESHTLPGSRVQSGNT